MAKIFEEGVVDFIAKTFFLIPFDVDREAGRQSVWTNLLQESHGFLILKTKYPGYKTQVTSNNNLFKGNNDLG